MGLILSVSDGAQAMWVRLSDSQLCAQSEVIVTGEIIGQTEVKRSDDEQSLWLGVLQVDEVLKGDTQLTVLLLVLPSPKGPTASNAITYSKGQKGIWFLRARTPEETGLYLADHPQRLVPAADAGDRTGAIQKIIKAQADAR